eukprot:1138285-Pelagomonas_calceolata.AAC.1
MFSWHQNCINNSTLYITFLGAHYLLHHPVCLECALNASASIGGRMRIRSGFGFIGSNQYLEVVLRQPVITPYVYVNQACPQKAFVKSFDDHSSSKIGAFSCHVLSKSGGGVLRLLEPMRLRKLLS